MSQGADAADQMINHSVNATVKVTEAAAKLAGIGAKNLAALCVALAKDNHKLSGKTSLTRILTEGKAPAVLNIKIDDMSRFSREAKKYGVLFTAIKDKTDTSGLCDVIVKQEDIAQINRIFERMGYAALKEPKGGEPKNPRSHPPQEKGLNMRGSGSKSTARETAATEKPSVVSRIEAIKAASGGKNKAESARAKTATRKNR